MVENAFRKRRHVFRQQSLKYLRYVLNDHFVLVLMLLLGFVLVQYSQLLQNFPKNPYPIALVLFSISLLLPFLGGPATYVQEADKLYFLTKEEEVIREVRKAYRSSFWTYSALQTAILVLVLPLFLKLGLSLIHFILFVMSLIFLRYVISHYRKKESVEGNFLNWDRVIAIENKRQRRILSFFALFTTVKGVTTSVKRRAYLDSLLSLMPQGHRLTWENLLIRALFRTGDYFGLTLRLFFISLLVLLFLPQKLLAVGLTLTLNYLLLFQLLGLYHVYDYTYAPRLFPVEISDKKKGLMNVLRGLAYVLVLFEVVATGFSWVSLGLILGQVVLVEIYLAYKIRKIVD